ncbi:MAG TPA: hypothetical protein VMP13_06585 [Acidimicrobiia bacterium]|nr:hypothetical protein [Acidimicrobiia bacterium]
MSEFRADDITWPSIETHDQVASRRQELYDAMTDLERAVARPSGAADWRIEIETALSHLEAALSDHTSQVEAEDGLFTEILDRAPHLHAAVETLRDEHRSLESACHRATSMSADWSTQMLRRRVNALLVRLTLHRQSGAELLFDAFNVDIPAGD